MEVALGETQALLKAERVVATALKWSLEDSKASLEDKAVVVEVVVAAFRTSDEIGILKADYYLSGFETFCRRVTCLYLEQDFSLFLLEDSGSASEDAEGSEEGDARS